MAMDKADVERLKERFKPALNRGRSLFGREEYDNHIKDVLAHYGYDVNDRVVKEIFGI